MTEHEIACAIACPEGCGDNLPKDRYGYHLKSTYKGAIQIACKAPPLVKWAEGKALEAKEWESAYMEAMKRGDKWKAERDALAQEVERLRTALQPFVKYHLLRKQCTHTALELVTSNGGDLKTIDWENACTALATSERSEQ